MVEINQDPQIYRTQQGNFKKMLSKYEKSRILIAREHLQWGFDGGNYIGIF
jgi:hypothetical protein